MCLNLRVTLRVRVSVAEPVRQSVCVSAVALEILSGEGLVMGTEGRGVGGGGHGNELLQ